LKLVIPILRRHPYLSLTAVGVILGLLSAGVVAASLAGWPRALVSFEDTHRPTLAMDADIGGEATIGRDSYFVGDTVTFTVRLLYRPDRVSPDLKMLERSLSFHPFEKIEVRSTVSARAGGLSEAMLEFTLQGVDVLPGTTYPLEPALVYYMPAGTNKPSPTPFRLERPAIHVSSYYPQDVSQIALHDTRGPFGEQALLRQSLLGGGAIAILVLAGLLLLRSGRRRRSAELSEPERLWQELHALDCETLGSRNYILHCERIFTRLLQWRVDLHPWAFWSGTNPAEPPSWSAISARARGLLSKTYQPDTPAIEDAERIGTLLKEMLSPVIDEERLRRENVPSFAGRLKQQPRILAVTGASAAIALLFMILAAQPALWLSPDLRRYNDTVRTARGETDLNVNAQHFAALGKTVEMEIVKAAALYNAGTARARLGGPAVGKFGEDEILHAVFQKDEPIKNLLDDQNSIDRLLNAGLALGAAERELKEAVRINRQDEKIRRNLELVGKRQRAVLAAIKQLFNAAGALPPAQRNAVIDVLNMKMPEAFKQEDKGKDNTRYMIMEKF
jgi:hypothetical protein